MQKLILIEFDALPECIDDAVFQTMVDAYLTNGPQGLVGEAPDFMARVISDVRGRRCPYPVMRMNRGLASLRIGERLVLVTDDPIAKVDVRHAIRSRGNLLRSAITVGFVDAFLVEKGSRSEEPDAW